MNRLKLYKEMRRQKRLIKITFIISIIILSLGLYIVDSSLNAMLGLEGKYRIIVITEKEEGIFDVSFMNQTREINLTYIQKDINNLKRMINGYYEVCRQYFDEFQNQVQQVIKIQ